MNDWIQTLSQAQPSTPVKAYLRLKAPLAFPGCQLFEGLGGCVLVLGQWRDIQPVLEKNRQQILEQTVECDRRNSRMPLLELTQLQARVEPGAILRRQVTVGKDAVIMMGAIVNLGAVIGEGTMVDMGAVIGGGAQVGKYCHIGAGAVIAGMVEPASEKPVVIGDRAVIGANGVILEGVCVGADAVVAAGAVVVADVPPGMVAAGCPARIIKKKDEKTNQKTALTQGLREAL